MLTSSASSTPSQHSAAIEAETGDEIRRDAPATLSIQERAVTASDYASKAELDPGVAKAAGDVPLDRLVAHRVRHRRPARRPPGRCAVRGRPARWSRALSHGGLRPRGERARVRAARDRTARVRRARPPPFGGRAGPARRALRCGAGGRAPGALPSRPLHVRSAGATSRRSSPRPIRSPVSSRSTLSRFQRQHEPWSSGIESGVIPMGRLEIARLDDDPSFPERGVLELSYGGGS